ncbi:MAG TPA: PilT/PilU family type 4a pilus ATPase [Kofleriaceae bacterium]|jgi:twitching motility protein PilT
MPAIESLLRVMTLRDAEAIVLETGKVPNLRRRGQLEAMAMPAIESAMLDELVKPYVEGKDAELAAGPLMVPITIERTVYVTTIERVASGLKVTARKGTPAKAAATAGPAPVAAAAPQPKIEHEHEHEHEHEARPMVADDARRSRIARVLSPIVAQAVERGASDVFVSTGQPPRARIAGKLETMEAHVDDAELAACVAGTAAHGGGIDLSLDLGSARVRVNAFDHLAGFAIAARIIKERVPALAELGLPAELAQVVDHRDGLVLVCGPTGSGKSTTCASLIDVLDGKRAAHVITIEDPIEYRFQPRRCLIHQRELGAHVPTFFDGLRAALREAPDVIVLGELRDRETLAAALTAAETGHLVFATLHAPNAIGAVDRVIDAFPEAQQRQIRGQLAACLRTIVTQFLLPRTGGGRVAAIELVPVTTAVANIIRKGDLHTLPTAIQSGREAGMIPLERSLAKLLDAGTVSAQAVRKIAADHDLLAALAGKLR